MTEIIEKASAMWKGGAYRAEIAQRFNLSEGTFDHLKRKHRDRFPQRIMGGDQREARGLDTITGMARGETLGKRFAKAFSPLPGTPPVDYVENRGCLWPIAADGQDPIESVLNQHACGRARVWHGERLLSYCGLHRKISREGV